ncbi:MAG: hypothetical protein AAF747_04605 [Planctomycetota bacterium]
MRGNTKLGVVVGLGVLLGVAALVVLRVALSGEPWSGRDTLILLAVFVPLAAAVAAIVWSGRAGK